jgi:hypothetical protein
MRMQEKTANPYWRLGATELQRFASNNKEAKLEELAHKKRMQQLEAAAAGYKSQFSNSSSP